MKKSSHSNSGLFGSLEQTPNNYQCVVNTLTNDFILKSLSAEAQAQHSPIQRLILRAQWTGLRNKCAKNQHLELSHMPVAYDDSLGVGANDMSGSNRPI